MSNLTKSWLSFKIDIASLHEYLEKTLEGFDGIVADDEKFQINKLTEFSSNDVQLVNSYLSDLDEETEKSKLEKPLKIQSAIENCKLSIVTKTYDNLSTIERKILLNLSLTKQELDELVSIYG